MIQLLLKAVMSHYLLSSWLLFACMTLSCCAVLQDCPSSECPTLSDIDLSPLQGIWETVYYSQAEGEENPDIPNFFNISLCRPLSAPTPCANSRLCYSEHLNVFTDIGQNCRYGYDAEIKQVKFVFDYAPGLVYGSGNVSVTLVCGRTLGVPEVLEGDPNSHAIEILWVTSAACKNSSSLAANTQEGKCYHIHPYLDNGLKAKFIDLTNLIRPEGYAVSYPERPASIFLLSVCRPLENVGGCSGAMVCLNQTDSGFNSDVAAPLKLGNMNSGSRLHVEGSLLTVVYYVSVKSGACFDSDNKIGNHSVKIHFLCPTGNEDLGPRITFLDDNLCLLVVHWYSSYACGNAAIQSTDCTLTTSLGLNFDLTGLSSQESVTSNTQLDSSGGQYRYDFNICSKNSLSTGCATRDQPIRVTQIDGGGVCHVLGVGAGRLRYVDGELTLMYGLGDPCHTNFARTTIIHFICPENVESNSSVITFSGEENCFYEFEWVTPLACGAQTSGVSSCQFESLGSIYNFAPLVGTEDENWIALDTQPDTECFMVNPCGTLAVAPDPHSSPADYCNAKLAPEECAGSSVCQVKKDGTLIKIGHFDFSSSSTQIHSADSNVLTVVGDETTTNLSAVVHYVCKVGDFTTPPIFIGVTNDKLYEFHWMTYAACPTGVELGNDCTVIHHSTGFIFNLTSLPVISFNHDNYQYNISICKPLPADKTVCFPGSKTNTSVCQAVGAHHYSLGNSSSALVYEDGTLKLNYTGGTQCHHNGNPNRNTTLVFVCDSTAHDPVVNDIDEDYCNYVIEIRTKKACPPAYQAHSCLHFTPTNTFDLSALSRASGTGNWETRGRDDSLYYINICQPLNSVVGCNPLAAVCRVQNNAERTKYTNIALASTANFTSSNQSGENFINLKYEYKNLGGELCPTVTTTIHLTCNKSSLNVEVGPVYLSGGDDANPCDYLFTWETVYACPIHPITSHTCSVSDPSGFTFDLSPLSSLNSTLSYFPIDTPSGHTYHISVCNPLDHPCNTTVKDNGTVAVCQIDSSHKPHRCGLSSTQTLTYFDGSLTMNFKGGDKCHHNDKNRSVLINFECDRTLVDYKGYPRFVSENEECGYTFDWPTALACPPQELGCLAGGGRYNLQPLLQQQVWSVRGLGNGFNYVIGGCRSLDLAQVPQCPQREGMVACRYRDVDPPGSGSVLGYISSDIVEEERGGALVLTYTNGDCSNGRRGVVHVHFLCGDSVGEPTLIDDNIAKCVVRIDWTTKYACSRDSRVADWFVEDPVTHQQFNLSSLPSLLFNTYAETDGSEYKYTVGLGGKGVLCPRQWKNDTQLHIGACQYTLHNVDNHTHNIHSLGYVNSNTTLQYIDGEISVEYRNGDECHHVSKERKTVVNFACEPSRDAFLEVFPERECEYTFTVHTGLVCRDSENIGVLCILPHFANLDVFQAHGMVEVMVNASAMVYFSVCSTLNTANIKVSKCPKGAAACLLNAETQKAIHLGKPNTKIPPKPLSGNEGVFLEYRAGGKCKKGTRYSTRLLLVCNRNILVGSPEFVDVIGGCIYTFRWESINACPINMSYTTASKDVCSINDTSSEFVYEFTNLVNSEQIYAIDSSSNTTYYIQLCGTKSALPSGAAGCNTNNTGICRKGSSDEPAITLVSATHKMVLTSHTPHTVEVVYTMGIPCHSPLQTWTAVVSLQCASRKSSTKMPIFKSADGCRLDFVWQNASFCVGEESCSVNDDGGHVYNFDGLFSQTWTGIVTSDSIHSIKEGGTFTMSVCRNLNPFSGSGSHCSSPAGICLHSPDGRHVNLGHMTGPPKIQATSDPHPTIQAEYSSGDVCNTVTGARYSTTLFLHCALEISSPILSLHEDAPNGNCSWAVAMETPLACPPDATSNSSECVMRTSEGKFDFTPLGKPLTFAGGVLTDTTYSVCLCKSAECSVASINSTENKNTTKLGTLSASSPVLSSVTGGPRLTFTGGDSCSDGISKIQSIIFMECNRSADISKGELILQTYVSDDCHKYFFWSTPYACISEEVSCTVATDNRNVLYDFSPLHSLGKPWQVKSGGDTYYINVCGAIEDRRLLEGCGPQSSVCVKRSDKFKSLATTSTQRVKVTDDGVLIRFSGDGTGCGSHVIVRMKCGVGEIVINNPSSGCYASDFTWTTPYACGEKKAVVSNDCNFDASLFSGDFSFQPTLLHQSSSYKTVEGNTTYYVNLCGEAKECHKDVSVCDGNRKTIASYKNQTIMAEGYQLLFQMTTGVSHAIVRVVCLVGDVTTPTSDKLLLENVGEQNEHTYYYFVLYITKGCKFDPRSTAPPATTNSPEAIPPGNSSTTAVVLTLLAIAIVLVVVLVLVFYKETRRTAAKLFLEKLIIGKANEPVKYHKLHHERDEETALMDGSSDSDSSESVSVYEEGGEGGALKVDVDITPENKETNSDEELINI